jgi:hypothetical protein
MDNTVKLYKINQTKAYRMDEQGEGFSLTPYSSNSPEYDGYDDGGKEYILPDDYKVGKTTDGGIAIFDNDDAYCVLSSKYGHPLLVSDKAIMLKAAK